MATISENLSTLNNIKNDIKKAINDKGGTAGDNMNEYAGAISALPSGGGTLPTGTKFAYSSFAQVNGIITNAVKNYTDMSYCFYNCSRLASISFPVGALTQVTNMSICFAYCSNITSISFPSGALTQVNTMISCFSGCNKLASISFPVGALTRTNNMSACFWSCASITSISFPEGALTNVTNMSKCFGGCTSLVDLTLYNLPNIALTNWNISSCTQLTHDSLLNIVNALPTATAARTCTLGSTNLAKLTADEKAIATGKGWTLN